MESELNDKCKVSTVGFYIYRIFLHSLTLHFYYRLLNDTALKFMIAELILALDYVHNRCVVSVRGKL